MVTADEPGGEADAVGERHCLELERVLDEEDAVAASRFCRSCSRLAFAEKGFFPIVHKLKRCRRRS